VLAESFERIHRSNLIGMGVLPLQFTDGATRKTLGLDGSETFDIEGLAATRTPHQTVAVTIRHRDKNIIKINMLTRLDTQQEVEYYRHGGILHYVLRKRLGGNP
jgi:aconitate hydratase